MSWRLAESLVVLLREVNQAAPDRSKLSDGTIGDPAHSSRVSDHNPNEAGVVRALDVTHDPDGGCDAHELAERIRLLGKAGGHPALGPGAYVISRNRIASDTEDGEPWDWEPYSGSNPHDKHAHVSVATAAGGYDSSRLWGVMGDEIDMATKADLRAVVDASLERELRPVLRHLKRIREVMHARHLRILAELDELEANKDADNAFFRKRIREIRTELAGVRADLEQLDDPEAGQ